MDRDAHARLVPHAAAVDPMKGFAHLSTLSRRASAQEYGRAFWNGDPLPEEWLTRLQSSGIRVTPDLAMTLSAMFSGVTMICYDLATLPPHTYRYQPPSTDPRLSGGKDRVTPAYGSPENGGIGHLAHLLRWQPNSVQTAVEFWLSMIAQYLLRGVAYAEIVPGPSGAIGQLLPRHPDRVSVKRLANGRLTYELREYQREARYLTQEEMFVFRDLSLDAGITSVSRVEYGAPALGAALATQAASTRFFKSGMTAAAVATYKGRMDDKDEETLHKSITRYATGLENSFGLMLIPDDVTITNLGIEPEKAQMMLAQEWGVREVARLLRMPGHKLGIQGWQSYSSQVQAAIDYVITCLRPIAVAIEQVVQRDLILEPNAYFVEFKLDALLRGDPASRAAYFSQAIRNRWLWPSEVRVLENFNPDPELDRLSAADHQPGASQRGTEGLVDDAAQNAEQIDHRLSKLERAFDATLRGRGIQ